MLVVSCKGAGAGKGGNTDSSSLLSGRRMPASSSQTKSSWRRSNQVERCRPFDGLPKKKLAELEREQPGRW